VRTLLDVDRDGSAAQLPSLAEVCSDDDLLDVDRPDAGGPPERDMRPADLHVLLRLASEKLERGEPEVALEILDACYRARPDDDSVQRLIATAESDYLRRVRCEMLPPDRIPVRAVGDDVLASAGLQPTEATLLGLVDGETDVRSILWTLPLREVEGLRALERLCSRGLIRLEERGADASTSGEPTDPDVEQALDAAGLDGAGATAETASGPDGDD
jgi:hypothetical protein